MTIITAAFLDDNHFIMASDSLCVSNGHWKTPTTVEKFIIQPDYMVGIAGSYHCFRKLRKALSPLPLYPDAEQIVDALHQINADHRDEWESEALIINRQGIWSVDCALSLMPIEQSFYAIGCGREAALGYLTGQALKGEVEFLSEEDITFSVAIACHLSTGCGEPIVFNKIELKHPQISIDKNQEACQNEPEKCESC